MTSNLERTSGADEHAQPVDLDAYEEQVQNLSNLTRRERDDLITTTADLLEHEVGSPEREAVINAVDEETLHALETKSSGEYKTMADFIEASRESRRMIENVGDVEVAEDGHLIDHPEDQSA